MVPLVMPARAAMSSMRVGANPFSEKQTTAARRISDVLSSFRRCQRRAVIDKLITDWSVIAKRWVHTSSKMCLTTPSLNLLKQARAWEFFLLAADCVVYLASSGSRAECQGKQV